MGQNLDALIRQLDIYHYFQPIKDLLNNKIFGFEALIRSRHFANPGKLFNYAKERGMQFELDVASILKACETFNTYYSNHHHLMLFMNIYPSTLIAPSFENYLQTLISTATVSPHSIVFEINETEKVTNDSLLKKTVACLKQQGFLIAIDDIGKGESTIKTILEIEPDIIKIDRYFAKDLATCPKKQKVIKFLLDFCGENTKVIIEGIETRADKETTCELGVPLGQGFFLGKPTFIEDYMLSVRHE